MGGAGRTPAGEPLNSAFLFEKDGSMSPDRYDKINLVPFGEYRSECFGLVNRITQEIGDFVPGTRIVMFPMAKQAGRVHLLRIGISRPGAPVHKGRRRCAGESFERRLLRPQRGARAASGNRAHAGGRKPPLDSPRHQRRHHRVDRSSGPRDRALAAVQQTAAVFGYNSQTDLRPIRAMATGSPGCAWRVAAVNHAGSPARRRP